MLLLSKWIDTEITEDSDPFLTSRVVQSMADLGYWLADRVKRGAVTDLSKLITVLRARKNVRRNSLKSRILVELKEHILKMGGPSDLNTAFLSTWDLLDDATGGPEGMKPAHRLHMWWTAPGHMYVRPEHLPTMKDLCRAAGADDTPEERDFRRACIEFGLSGLITQRGKRKRP